MSPALTSKTSPIKLSKLVNSSPVPGKLPAVGAACAGGGLTFPPGRVFPSPVGGGGGPVFGRVGRSGVSVSGITLFGLGT